MERQIITGLMAIMVGLAGWNLKTTYDLSIAVSNMQISNVSKESIQEMRMAIQRLELLLLENQ
jgi:hypothetical protein